jgi:tryptophan-rich sensory protein
VYTKADHSTKKLKESIMKQFKEHHLYIPTIAVVVLLISSWLSAGGMDWYQTLALPWYTPPSWVFPIVWNIIYFLTIISAIIFWDTVQKDEGKEVKWLFLLNALLNGLWTFFFFYMHMIGASLAVSVLLECTLVLMILLMWPVSKRATLLLMPYLLWVAFATVLNYGVWTIN